MPTETKQDVLNDIARLIGRPARRVSRGSTEPREAYEDIVQALKLPIGPGLTKTQLAGAIARAGGQTWDDSCHSDNTPSGGGGTITLTGDRRVREAVRELLRLSRGPALHPARSSTARQIQFPSVAEATTFVAEEAPDYGSTGDVEWEPVATAGSQVREGAFQVASDGVRQRDLVNAALRGHFATVQRLKDAIEATGAKTKQGRASVDLLAEWPDGFKLLAEVKTVPSGLVARVRLGLAQLFEYRFRSKLPADTPLALVFDRAPGGPEWLTQFIAEDRRVNLIWFDKRFTIRGPQADQLIGRLRGSVKAGP